MDLIQYILAFFLIAALAILLCFAIFDFWWFLRMGVLYLIAKRSKKISILSEASMSGICLPTDIDIFLGHMSNSRCLRELDFARNDFCVRTKLFETIQKHGASVTVGSTAIRYRKFIKLFSKYVITTKIVHWEKNTIFVEYEFRTPADNNFLNVIAFSKIRLIDIESADVVINEIFAKYHHNIPGDVVSVEVGNGGTKLEKPVPPPELKKWMECDEISSERLRNS